MDEGLVGQVGHARGHLTTVAQEGVALKASGSICSELVFEVSLLEKL